MQQTQLRKSVFPLAQKHLVPVAGEIDRNYSFPGFSEFWWLKLGEVGLFGINAPSEYGGSDATYFDHLIVMEEFSRTSGGVAPTAESTRAYAKATMQRNTSIC